MTKYKLNITCLVNADSEEEAINKLIEYLASPELKQYYELKKHLFMEVDVDLVNFTIEEVKNGKK